VTPLDLGQCLLVPTADGHHQVGVTGLLDLDHHSTVFDTDALPG
jgi:hypothetical protein